MTRRNFFQLAAAAGLAPHAKGLYAAPSIIAPLVDREREYASTSFSFECDAPYGVFVRVFNRADDLILAAEIPPHTGRWEHVFPLDPPLLVEEGIRSHFDLRHGTLRLYGIEFTATPVEL